MKKNNIILLTNIILLFGTSFLFSGVTRKPYLQVLTPSSVSIRWQTDIYSVGKVYYGVSVDSLFLEKLESENKKVEHEVLLSGLMPNTKYYYSVEGNSGGNSNQFFITAPEVGSKDSVRIWVIADFGQKSSKDNKRREETVAVWKEFNNGYHADFVLSLGDQTEDDTRFQLQHNFFSQLEEVFQVSPFYTAEGNHDNHDDVEIYYRTFTLPKDGECGGEASCTEDYYSFNYANIHVVVLSTEIKDFGGGKQAEWLKNDLEKNNQDWLIACVHRPMHSGGHHKSNTDPSAIKEKKYWLPILEDYGVDLVLQGHNHIYERSYLVDNITGSTDDITKENKIDTTLGRIDVDGAYQKIKGKLHQGTIFIEVAAGGHANDNFVHYPIFPVYYHSVDDEGSLVIDVVNNRMDVKFLCTEPDSTENHVWDHFTIIKVD